MYPYVAFCRSAVQERGLSRLAYIRKHLRVSCRRSLYILFLGRDEFSCLVLEQLYRNKDVWEELVIVTQPDVKTGRRGSKLSISPLKTLGQQLGLPVHFIPPDKGSFKTWQPPSPFSTSPTELVPPTHILVTASFGRILPNSLLQLFQPSRRLNVHPSLLPAYRGAAPIQHALIDGQRETGVCVIEMMERKKGIDAGAIWAQRRMEIGEEEMFLTLRDTLAREGGQLLVSVLRDMIDGKAVSVPQPTDPAAPRAPAIQGEDAMLNFEKMSAEEIVRRHRAISHQKPLFTYLKTKRTLQIHSPRIFTEPLEDDKSILPIPGVAIYHPPSESLLIRCALDSIIAVPQVKQQDRSLLKAKEWWNGVRPDMRITEGENGPVQFIHEA
ncbi:Formyltransferase [Wolfiporia cocos MD-104 SS10]|uniref:methionyl-tRNA formyltransferase n=1 Tax=Wolfiporia cocos (strain MD-104) TaxID=742152 RepID=A0A2H3IZH3_WOLCO|nr:Formyltransferase [Wolfiporia cocos MD-104 SS10]